MCDILLGEGIAKKRDTGENVPYIMTTLTPEDIEMMLRLQDEIIGCKGFDISWFYPFCCDELKEIMNIKGNLVIGVFAEKELVAFRVSCICGEEFKEIAHALGDIYEEGKAMLLNGVFVKNDFRGNNMQQIMSQYTADECEKHGIKVLMTAIHPDNIASIKSLENIGFKKKKRAMLYEGKYDRVILVKDNR